MIEDKPLESTDTKWYASATYSIWVSLSYNNPVILVNSALAPAPSVRLEFWSAFPTNSAIEVTPCESSVILYIVSIK